MSFNMSNGGESSFLELNSETASELKLKKKNKLESPGRMCSHPQQNVKLGSFNVVVVQRPQRNVQKRCDVNAMKFGLTI